MSFDLGAGAAWGLGAGYDVRGSVDVDAAKAAALEGLDHATGGAVTRAEHGLDEARSAVQSVASDLGSAGGSALSDVKQAFEGLFKN